VIVVINERSNIKITDSSSSRSRSRSGRSSEKEVAEEAHSIKLIPLHPMLCANILYLSFLAAVLGASKCRRLDK
jgi:hypothetical protein